MNKDTGLDASCAYDASAYFHFAAFGPTNGPTQISIPWTSLAQAGWGHVADFEPSAILQLQWQVSNPNLDGMLVPDFAFTLDDVSFY